jgi:hypothetical protein
LRGILSGVEEKDINEKIWHTAVHSDVEHKDITLENFVFPEINNAKRALISTFLDHGYHVIGDAVHAKGTQWDDFDAQYATKADIKHILVGPENLLT